MIKFLILFIAIMPVLIWLYLLLRQRHANKWLILITFIGGILAAVLVLVYQGYWGDTINFIFFKVDPVNFKENIYGIIGSRPILALFLSFIGVGVIEELGKFSIMRFINRRFFKSINDVIELAIVSALGFAFLENIIYFSAHWGQLSTGNFFIFALMRVSVVTMVHMLCSGIFGYYYGMGYFSSPMLKIQKMKEKHHPILEFLQEKLHMDKANLYSNQMMITGLLLAMVVHAFYDFFLSINIGVLVVPIMSAYLFGGFWFLSYLLKKKDLNLKLGLVGTDIMPKEDFTKLIGQIQEIKSKMKDPTTDAPEKTVTPPTNA